MGGRGSGGHNRKSAAQHYREGTYRADRHGALPKGLSRNERARIKRLATKYDKDAIKKGISSEAKSTAAKTQSVDSSGTSIKCPAWFDEIARAEFTRVCNILVERGTLADVNHATLEGYCSAYSTAVRADMVLNEKGFNMDVPLFSKKGDEIGSFEKERPEVARSARFWGLVKAFAVQLGITQNAGSEKTGEKKSPMDDFLDEQSKRLP
jgi:phage terminase small subunit